MTALAENFDTTWFANALSAQLTQREKSILTHIAAVSNRMGINGTKATFTCYHLRKDSKKSLRTSSLIDLMSETLIDYCIPRTEKKKVLEKLQQSPNASFNDFERLRNKAKNLFCKSVSSGEGGEMLLYLLAEETLGLVQIINKMPLKTNDKLHYNGADGMFAKYDSGCNKLCLYWGESKLHAEFGKGIADAMKSLKPFLDPNSNTNDSNNRDIELINDNIDFLDEALENAILKYLDLGNDMSNYCAWRGLCFLGFDSSIYRDISEDDLDAEIKAAFEKSIEGLMNSCKTQIIGKYLTAVDMEIICLPLQSVSEFRKSFLERIGYHVD